MLAVSFLSATAYLIEEPPDWNSSEPVVEGVVPNYFQRGTTGRETRTPLGSAIRISLSYDTVFSDPNAIAAFRNGLQDLKDKRVLCPLWVYPIAIGTSSPTVKSDYYVMLGDGTAPDIQPAASLPFSRVAYPLLVGKFANIPDPVLFDDEKASASIQFVESDDYSLDLSALDGGGIIGADGLFPWRPNWKDRPHSGNAEVEIERQKIGEGRKDAVCFYDQRSRRHAQQGFTLTGTDPWKMLRLFQNSFASVGTFWLPTGISDARLTADVASGDSLIAVSNPSGRGSNTVITLDDLAQRKRLIVSSTSGSNWNLSTTVGAAFLKQWTRIESTMLARFDMRSISISFQEPTLASCGLKFIETPWEVSAVGGETLGTTMGAVALSAYLYVFTIAYPGASQKYYFTDFETDLSDGVNTYAHSLVEHGDIVETATLERQQSTMKARNFIGNPLALMIPFSLEWPLQIEIFECTVSGGVIVSPTRVFSGEVEDADYDGPYINATLKSFGALFDRKFPGRVVQPTCNWAVFEPLPKCGLALSDWTWTGVVTAYNASTNQITLGSVARTTGPALTLVADFFESGYFFFGTGTNQQYRLIISSTAAVSGSLTITGSTPLRAAPAIGATVTFYPGCDGKLTTCIGKFNNMANFGGFAFMPVGNPSFMKVSKAVGSGKK